MTYYKINYDDSKPTIEPVELHDETWLEDCYNAIDCQLIEVVPTAIRHLVLIIDEEGKLWDGWQKRINTVASIMNGSYDDFIVGNAILAREHEGELQPPTEKDMDFIRLCFPF